ncbi:MAG: rod shape-determining protein MreC [Rubricella sp.]
MPATGSERELWRTTRRIVFGVAILICVALFALWRSDSPRVERLRMTLTDTTLPAFEWTTKPLAALTRMANDFEAYVRVYEENRELRRDLQEMRGWREAAIQLEQQNARLRALNNVRLAPRLGYVTAEVLTDTGGPFAQSGIVNVGRRNGVEDGAAVLDGLGVVGRVSGLGEETARVMYLTDISSRVPVLVQPSGQTAIVTGDNTAFPRVDFVEDPDTVRPGDRVVTSGDARVLPPDLLVGQIVRDAEGRLRLRPSADYGRLDYVRVLDYVPPGSVQEPGGLIGPLRSAPPAEPDTLEQSAVTE